MFVLQNIHMKLTILGCGTCCLDSKVRKSGYLLEADNKQYLFDSGPGVLHRLIEKGVDMRKLDHLFFTHTHNDHVNDLSAIIWGNQLPGFRDHPLFLYGPTGFEHWTHVLIEEILSKEFLKFPIKVSEVTNKTFTVDNLKITTKELNHFKNIAYRIEHDGKVIVYTGDTEYTDDLIEICKDADLVIMECGQVETDERVVHMTPGACAKVASQANAKKIVLVHLYPHTQKVDVISEVKKSFDGEVLLGKDLMEFNV